MTTPAARRSMVPIRRAATTNDHIQGTPEPETVNLFAYVAGTCDATATARGGLFADQPRRPDGSHRSLPTICDDGDAAPRRQSGVSSSTCTAMPRSCSGRGATPSTDSPNVTDLTTFGRRIAYFNGYTPEQSNELYFTDGTTDDSMYGLLGVAAYTIETNGFDFFEDCATFEGNTAPTNLAALRYIARTLHAPYMLPAGPDTIEVDRHRPISSSPGDTVSVHAHLDSAAASTSRTARSLSTTSPARWPLPRCAAVGRPTPASAMQASGRRVRFAVETASPTIDTTGLSSGRHFVYVQAGDTASNAGTPNGSVLRRRRREPNRHDHRHRHRSREQDPLSATSRSTIPTTARPDTATSDAIDRRVHRACVSRAHFNVTVSAPHYI